MVGPRQRSATFRDGRRDKGRRVIRGRLMSLPERTVVNLVRTARSGRDDSFTFVKADIHRPLFVNVGKVIVSCRAAADRRPSALADEGAFVFDNRMAGYGAEPPPECPTDDACERQVMAEFGPSTLNRNCANYRFGGTGEKEEKSPSLSGNRGMSDSLSNT
jgi:hypothetical protein